MSDNPLISVVIPVYKVEQYLNECVDSVIAQTYKNLDIILVDDGSPDNCPAICDDYAEKDTRVRVIHRPNGGLSAARNSGIDIARGEYITFIDSDDYVSMTYVEQLYMILKNSGAEISVCGVARNTETLDDSITPNYELYSAHDAIKSALGGGPILRAAWGKLYPIRIFADIGGKVRYPEGSTAEDLYVMPLVFDLAGTIAVTKNKKYFYRIRNDSLWFGPFDSTKLDYFTSISFVEEYLSLRHPDLMEYVRWDKTGNTLYILRSALKAEYYDSRSVAQILQRVNKINTLRFIVRRGSIKSKIGVLLMIFTPKLYSRIIKRVNKFRGK